MGIIQVIRPVVHLKKKIRTDGWTDDGQRPITIAHSCELK